MKRKIAYGGIRWPMVILTTAAAASILYLASIILHPKIKPFFNFINPVKYNYQIDEYRMSPELSKVNKNDGGLENFVFKKRIKQKASNRISKTIAKKSHQTKKRDISNLPEPRKHGRFLNSVVMNKKNTYNITIKSDSLPIHINFLSAAGENLYSIDTFLPGYFSDTTIVDKDKIEKILESREKLTIKKEYNHTINK